MACVESTLVIYLRALYYPNDPNQIFPLELLTHQHLVIELVREIATLTMILSVAFIAKRSAMYRFAAFVFVFGVWDIFYYVWLKLMIGWPFRWHEWDVLFLIPWVWLGPWIAPALIALLFVIWGAGILLAERECAFQFWPLLMFVIGCLLVVTAFLLPAFPLLTQGEQALRGYVPSGFAWWLYGPGLVLMIFGLYRLPRF